MSVPSASESFFFLLSLSFTAHTEVFNRMRAIEIDEFHICGSATNTFAAAAAADSTSVLSCSGSMLVGVVVGWR